MRRACIFLFLLLASSIGFASAPSDPGIYAIIRTNHGDITCRLFFEAAPMTVANFVGLAEGTRPSFHREKGPVQQPFYDGLIFHRVIKGFMIQGGCPIGQGTSGPGYVFWDEVSRDLPHDRPGILSMANSGPHTNGSQFFVTVEPTPWLNGKHSVFGEVIGGMDVVNTISNVETASDRPVESVVIEKIEIVRNGAAAEAFDPSAQSLPAVVGLRPQISAQDGVKLHYPRKQYSSDVLFTSDDLGTWTKHDLPHHFDAPTDEPLDVSTHAAGKDRQFYRLASVDYGFVRSSVVGQRVELSVTSDDLLFVLDCKLAPADTDQQQVLGTGTFNGGEPRNLDYRWYQEKQHGTLLFILEDFNQINVFLHFTTESSGTFTATVQSQDPFPIFGTFTLSPL